MTFPEPKIWGDYWSSEQMFHQNDPLGSPDEALNNAMLVFSIR